MCHSRSRRTPIMAHTNIHLNRTLLPHGSSKILTGCTLLLAPRFVLSCLLHLAMNGCYWLAAKVIFRGLATLGRVTKSWPTMPRSDLTYHPSHTVGLHGIIYRTMAYR